MTERNILTAEQQDLVSEFVETYGLEPEQISFDGDNPKPIFDYGAMCVLRVALTDFQDVTVKEPIMDKSLRFASVECSITLADGRTVSVNETAEKGEIVGGETIETFRQIRNIARSRAMRTAIRSCGVNLIRAHRDYLETGKKSIAQPVDPRHAAYSEIHLLAQKLGFITGNDKTEYQNLIAELYEGRTSAKDLNDIELRRLLTTLRSFERRQQPSNQAA